MSKVHNKKRNIGIIYEQIIKFICNKMLENDHSSVKKGIRILKESFKEGTQLSKEYKLFKALANTNNINDNLATSIIIEAKKASNKLFDNDKLEREKSILIKQLNYNFGKGTIFKENIENYKAYATIQTLLNEWRNENNNFDLVTEYEIKLHSFLTEAKNTSKDFNNNVNTFKEIDSLTLKIMSEMFEKKYTSLLNNTQNRIIDYYSKSENNSMLNEFISIKKETENLLERYIRECKSKPIIDNYMQVKRKLSELSVDDFSKESLCKFLTVAKLYEELSGE
jgi:hypothetical protein